MNANGEQLPLFQRTGDMLIDLLGPREPTLEKWLLAASCQHCGKPMQYGESYLVAGNPSVTWVFHFDCWQLVPMKFRRSLDVYGGLRYGENLH